MMSAAGQRARILYAPLIPPARNGDGGNLRSAWLLDALRSQGSVDVVLFHPLVGPVESPILPSDVGRIEWTLSPRSPRNSYRGMIRRVLLHRRDDYFRRPRKIEAPVGRWRVEEYDLVVARYAKALAYLFAAGVRPRRCLLDLDDHDLAWWEQREQRAAGRQLARWLRRRARRQIGSFFDGLLAACDEVWISNQEDAARIRKPTPTWLPNLPGIALPDPLPPRGQRILCVSSWGHAGNRAGLCEFLREGWPLLQAAQPGVVLHVVGRGFPDQLPPEFKVPGIVVRGAVDDLAEEYEQCAFTLAPVAFGVGSSIKVIESLTCGRICVASPVAARGQDPVLQASGALRVGPSSAALVAHCRDLLHDLDAASAGAQRGFAWCRENLNPEVFAAIVADTLGNAMK